MSRSATELIKIIRDNQLRVFTTADLATLAGLSGTAASHALLKLSKESLIAKIKRALWANQLSRDLSPLEVVPQIMAPWPCYVSLYSALADYGVIEEIPRVIYAVTSARPARLKTPLGDFHIHHLPPRMIWGYEIKTIGSISYPIAEPEKAFLDLVYLALTPRSPIGLPHKRDRHWDLEPRKLKHYARRFDFGPLTEYLKKNRLY